MQERHTNRQKYFDELVESSRKYFLPYVERFMFVGAHTRVLEIGCGDGGNLLPFAEKGCQVTGIDLSDTRIEQAKHSFKDAGCQGTFTAMNVFDLATGAQYDILLIHDVIEHITDKAEMLRHIKRLIAPGGLLFIGFPAWQMPFGGHQQICHNKWVSHFPFLHLLPSSLYRFVLCKAGEPATRVSELLDIKSCATTIELFEKLSKDCGYHVHHRQLWFINPHYEVKFGLRPRTLSPLMAHIPHLRNFFTTSCFYMLRVNRVG